MGKYDDRPYEVGKGKPPRTRQFKKGESGNPRGPRHKKKAQEATLATLVHEAANELMVVIINDREVRLPKKQAIIIGIMNDAIVGTPAQRLKAFKVLAEAGAFEPFVEDDRVTPEMEEENIAKFIKELARESLDHQLSLPPSRRMFENPAEQARLEAELREAIGE